MRSEQANAGAAGDFTHMRQLRRLSGEGTSDEFMKVR